MIQLHLFMQTVKRSYSEVGDDMAEKTYEEAMARLDEIIDLLEKQ